MLLRAQSPFAAGTAGAAGNLYAQNLRPYS